MKFIYYDVIFLVLFLGFLAGWYYLKRKNWEREGLLMLYRTKIGLNLIESASRKYKTILHALSYAVIVTGYALMAVMLYLLGQMVYLFALRPDLVRAVKVPPLMPLVPYLPEIFKVEFLPPFYFTYWIIAIAVIALCHEFSHGIFARINGVKVKSTGIGFLGPFLAAFVEPNEKQMQKKSKFAQLSVLSAGTFANILMALIFAGLMALFFVSAYAPAGVQFNTYTFSVLPIAGITQVNGVNITGGLLYNIANATKTEEINITFDDEIFFAPKQNLISQLDANSTSIIAYDNLPAYRAKISGPVTKINGIAVKNPGELSKELAKYHPGENISVSAKLDGKEKSYFVTLGKSPLNESRAVIGIGLLEARKGVMASVFSWFTSFNNPAIYYEARIGQEFAVFIYNLLWWIVILNLSVAMINMLPVAIFDGGRVFYLTIAGIFRSEEKAKQAYKIATSIILLIFLLLMLLWVLAFL